MKKLNKKNVFIYLSTLLIFLSLFNKGNKDEVCIERETPQLYEEFSTYSNGNVYFCNSVSNARQLYEFCSESDVVVVDQRYFDDPNMKIISSYTIKNPTEMHEILEVISEYCDTESSNWNRSIESMQNEWIIHNMCSTLSIKKDSTDDVDLNNGDENLYKSKIISKMLGN